MGTVFRRDAKTAVVETTKGKVQGYLQNDIFVFKGIPYAKAQRFHAPEPVPGWTDVFDASSFGFVCPLLSLPRPNGELYVPHRYWPMDEDCLNLNLWTPGCDDAKRPVMVWLHGGGYESGSAIEHIAYEGENMSRYGDVVTITVNHRLNIIGYFDLSDFGDEYANSGNAGGDDIIAALKWVRDNVERFGGDPDNVTVFGQSGGGGKVGTLMCMPAARGLFHKAIIQSGTILNGNTSEITREIGLATLEELGLTPADAGRLADIPYEELYRAGHAAVAKIAGDRKPGSPGFRGFGPTVDGEVLVCQPFQPSFAEFSKDIPLIMGTTFNELQRSWYAEKPSLEEAAGILRRSYGDSTDDYIRAFRKAYPEFDTPADMLSVDSMFRPSTIFTADTRAGEGGAPVYMYMFAWKSPIRGGVMGAAHAYELPFVFHTTEVSAQYLGEETGEIRHLADMMSAAWTAFARCGDPSTAYLDWKPYTADEGACAYFGHSCEMRYNYDRELITIMQEN